MAVTKKKARPEPVRQEQPRSPGKGKEVATKPKGEVSIAEFDKMMDEDAGKGLSTDASDNLVPLIYVLQPLSPQVLKKNEGYIEDAEAGHIWLRNSDDPLHETITFQPCYFYKDWIEWVPRNKGGGYAGRHADKPTTAVQWSDPENPQSIKWRLPNGNDVVETRYYAGFVMLENRALPYIIPLSSTGHSVGKEIMFRLNNMRNPRTGKKPALYGNKITLRTKMRSNAKGEWYVFDIVDIELLDADEAQQYLAGRNLAEAFDSGAKQAEAPVDESVRGDADDEGSM